MVFFLNKKPNKLLGFLFKLFLFYIMNFKVKHLFKSLLLNRAKKESYVYRILFYFFLIILYELNIDDNLVRVCFILLRVKILTIIDK